MSLFSVHYVSKSTLSSDAPEMGVAEIVGQASARNPLVGLTGALLFTETHFAQVLEGPCGVVDEMMATITRDKRHENLKVADRRQVQSRRFSEWSMGYFGPSQFVSQKVLALIRDPGPLEQQRASAWLADLIHEFSKS